MRPHSTQFKDQRPRKNSATNSQGTNEAAWLALEKLSEPPRPRKVLEHIKEELPHQEPSEYKYLKPSVKVKTGLFKYEFDLRFDELRDTMVTKGYISIISTLYPQMFKYEKEHPHTRKEPGPSDQEELERQLRILKPDFTIFTERDIRYTWIGHSTAVIQIGPDNFLIDPIFKNRASPNQLVGPKRFRPPPCTIQELPKISAVMISHDHYDHCDEVAHKALLKYHNPIFIAGLGTQNVLPKQANNLLMDWMDETIINISGRKYKITFVPVCHWGKRGLNDFNTRLWGGYVIETPFNQKLFFSGDTGYCPVFKQIGKKFGPFDLTILPIGAYQPRAVLRPQHVNPQEAVIVHKELRSRQSVAVHWGTFPLGAEGYFQARGDLAEARKKHNLPDEDFITISHGESVIFKKKVDKAKKN